MRTIYILDLLHTVHNISFKLVQIINSVNIDFGEDLRFWNMNTKDDMTDILNYLSDIK